MKFINKQEYNNRVFGFNMFVYFEENGVSWFDAAEICKAIGLQDVTSALRRLDDDEKCLVDREFFDSAYKAESKKGGAQAKWFINESGLYHLVLQCELPKAKPFRKWVTSEVLPSIRKEGSYSLVKRDLAEQKIIDLLVAYKPLQWSKQFFPEFWKELSRVEGHTTPNSRTGFAGWMGGWLRKYLIPLFPQEAVNEIDRRNPRKQWRNSRCPINLGPGETTVEIPIC